MRQILKGSTDVSVTIYIIDSTDGTPETGVVFDTAGIDLQYHREGAAVVAITEATLAALTTAHTDGGFLTIGFGAYRLDVPDAAFATGAETVDIIGTVTGMIVLPQAIQLVNFNPEDGVRLGLTALPNAAADAAGGLPISDAGGLDLDAQRSDVAAILVDTGTTLDDLIDTEIASIITTLGTPAGASLAADVAAVKVDTAAILVDTGTTLDGRIPAALVSGRMDASVGAMAANVVTAAALAADAGAEIADAVLDEDMTGHQTQGSLGQAIGDPVADTNTIYKAVVTDANGATVGVDVVALKAETVLILEDTGTTLQAEVDGIQADTEDLQARIPAALVGGRMDASVGAMAANVLTAAATAADFGTELAAAIWDALTSGMVTVGSIGKKLADWVVGTIDTYTGNTKQTGDNFVRLGAPAGASVSADVAAVKAETASIQTDTNDLQSRTPAALVGGRMDSSLGAVAAGVDLSATMKASVNTEVVDALNVDIYAEPGQGAPAATASLAVKLNYLYKAWRNRHTQTATQYSLYGDDALTVDQKATVSDDATTFDRTEVATGP